MSTILLKNIDTLATFDEQRRVLRNAWILIKDNTIVDLGTRGTEPVEADQMPGAMAESTFLSQFSLRWRSAEGLPAWPGWEKWLDYSIT